jgi:hypothetical protein
MYFALEQWRMKNGAPAWMKLITTLLLECYEILSFGPQTPPGAANARQSHYDRLPIVS